MCLLTIEKEPTILTEDLVVYKKMKIEPDGTFRSIFYDKKWRRGLIYSTKLQIEKYGDYFDDIAYDEYKKAGIIIKTEDTFSYRKDARWVSEGFHWFAEQTERGIWGTLVKCIVPAGAKVYRDVSGLGVSDKLKVVGVCK
jgi:hypothetical protein